jgi:hypothetical protein
MTGRRWRAACQSGGFKLLAACAWMTVLASAGCREDSYALVSVVSYTGRLDGVARLRVHVTSAAGQKSLSYAGGNDHALTLDSEHPVTFSVEFGASYQGSTQIEVEPVDASEATLGYGQASVRIDRGEIAGVRILVVPDAVRPARGSSAGEVDGGASGLLCAPALPTEACGPDRTCGVLCAQGQPTLGMCYAAGAGSPGTACSSNRDCQPGSQCFAFSAPGCSVRTCLRFCNHDDAQCAEQGSYCNIPVPCDVSAQVAACSRPCDPTGAASAGCASGLACFVYAGETTDCACPGLGDIGSPCTQNSGCADTPGCAGCRSGLSCIVPAASPSGTAGTCRPVCTLAAPACPSGTTCRAFEGSTKLLFGFCQ